jgi:DNA modification methylase
MNYKTSATPKAETEDGIPVFCSFDEIVRIGDLKPNPRNPNEHNEAQVKLLASIIESTGWRTPITVSKRSGLIVKGHGRQMAALQAGLQYAPVDYQEYSTEAEEYADLIADNRIAELANLNMEKLVDMVQEIDTGETPIELTGFTKDDLAQILAAMEEPDDVSDDGVDTVDVQEEEPFSCRGDLWHLGSHRLLCGSATSDTDIDRLMDGNIAQMVHTDPPYGVSYKTQSGKFEMIKNDDKTDDDLVKELLFPAFKNYVRSTKDDAAFYIWHSTLAHQDFVDAMTAAGMMEKQQLIWVKNFHVLGRSDYQWNHEPCIYGEKAGHHAKWYGDRSQNTAWTVVLRNVDGLSTTLAGGIVLSDGEGHKLYLTDKQPKRKKVRFIRLKEGRSICLYHEEPQGTVWKVSHESKTVHPTQKPVELPVRAITNSSQTGDIVLDFFGGSGSTLIAAEMTGRICYSVELEPKYVDAIVRRYIETSGNISGVFVERDGKQLKYVEITK